MHFLALSLVLLHFFQTLPKTIAHPTTEGTLPLPYQVLHQFSNPTWIENLAVRHNGKLLLTDLLTPTLYHLDPSNPSNPVLVHTFTNYTGLLGITELGHDIFYLAAGNLDLSSGNLGIGTYAIWKVDMRGFDECGSAKVVEKVADIPEAHLLNGLTTFSDFCGCGIVLMADSALGLIWKLDVGNRNYSIAIQVPEMGLPSSSAPATGLPVGINGIKVFGDHVYWTNSGNGTFNRIRINDEAQAIGLTEILASKQGFEDDFVLDREGTAFIATDAQNTISVIFQNGTNVTVEGGPDQLAVAGSTSCQFGRTPGKFTTLYVATNGGLSNPLPGNVTEGGKVVAIDTKGFM